MSEVNIWAIVLSAIASMVIGSIWYGPLFGKIFMKARGMDQWSEEKKKAEQQKMGKTYFVQLIGSLVMFYVLAILTGDLNHMSLGGGVMTALWVWIGFIVPTKLGDAIWGGNMTLFYLGIGNMFVTLLASGAIIGALK